MIAVSAETAKRVHAAFPVAAHALVLDILLNECGDNLPLVDTSYTQLAERIRFAVIDLSRGDVAQLRAHIKEAQTDWRDVLVAAGFSHGIHDHRKWREGKRH